MSHRGIQFLQSAFPYSGEVTFFKKEGHFFRVCAMLCIEAGESFPEMSGDRTSLILGRGKKGNRTSCGPRALLPSTVLPGRNCRRCARQVKKTGCESEKETTQIALTTRSGSPLSE